MTCKECWEPLPGKGENHCSRCGQAYDATDPASYYTGVLRWYDLIDLHIVYLLLPVLLLAFILAKQWSWLLLAALLPQGRILMHWTDLRRHTEGERKRVNGYLCINELFTAALVGTACIVHAMTK